MTNPGLMPVPLIVTSFSLARRSSFSAKAALCSVGKASSSAEVTTLRPACAATFKLIVDRRQKRARREHDDVGLNPIKKRGRHRRSLRRRDFFQGREPRQDRGRFSPGRNRRRRRPPAMAGVKPNFATSQPMAPIPKKITLIFLLPLTFIGNCSARELTCFEIFPSALSRGVRPRQPSYCATDSSGARVRIAPGGSAPGRRYPRPPSYSMRRSDEALRVRGRHCRSSRR